MRQVSNARPSRIEDYAIIGDGKTGALVGLNGSIDWLCWPRFDSDACLAALLGTSEHGHWSLAPVSSFSAARSYRGDTLIPETIFESETGTIAIVDFMPVRCTDSAIVRRVEGRRGTVSMGMELNLRFDCASSTPWITSIDDRSGMCAILGPNMVVLRTGIDLAIGDEVKTARFDVAEGEKVDFTLAWGQSTQPIPGSFAVTHALEDTYSYRSQWSSSCKYDGAWRQAVLRSLLTLKALTFSATGGIVAALTTSLPEQLGGVRNWDYRFCWLRDATLTLTALMAGGHNDEAREWRHWLHRAIAGRPEELQIMYGIAGERRLVEWTADWLPGYEGSRPVRVGNAASEQLQLDIYGEVMNAIHVARLHAVEEPDSAWAMQRRFVDHLIDIWDQPDDGIWEVRGGRRHSTHSKVMAWVAVDRAIRDATLLKAEAPFARWREVRDRMHTEICEKGFDAARNTFTQSYGRPELDASLLLIPATGFLPATDPRVMGTVKAIEEDLLSDGVVLRYRSETGGDGLPPGEGAFLPCSFWLVNAYKLQGRDQEARELFEKLVGLSNDLGLLSEEYDPATDRLVGNFPQAFSHLALISSALMLDGHRLGREDETGRVTEGN